MLLEQYLIFRQKKQTKKRAYIRKRVKHETITYEGGITWLLLLVSFFKPSLNLRQKKAPNLNKRAHKT